MTYDQIRRCKRIRPGMDLQELSERINELSGLTKEARKNAIKSTVG